MQLFKVETFSQWLLKSMSKSITYWSYSSSQLQTVSQLTETVKVLLRIAQYDFVERINNTNTEACSDDLPSDRLYSFIFKAINAHFSFGQFSHSMSMFVFAAWSLDLARRHQIYLKYLVSFLCEFRPSMNCSLH